LKLLVDENLPPRLVSIEDLSPATLAAQSIDLEFSGVFFQPYCNSIDSECIVTHVAKSLSTSDQRRETVINSAIAVFAKAGYLGTPIAAVAKHAKISPAYVFKLFPRKEELFVAALEHAFEQIHSALDNSFNASADQTPDDILFAMGGAYAALIANRSLLMIQVHALSVADVPEIGAAFRKGLRKVAEFVKVSSGASDEAVQRFFAYGQLCHLIATTYLDGNSAAWARMLTKGIRHY
jgi:AcrR family transcriptional regulator